MAKIAIQTRSSSNGIHWASKISSRPTKYHRRFFAEDLIGQSCYGHIYRTLDYPDAVEIFENAGYSGGRSIAVSRATKIGGVPVGSPDAPHSNLRHLCSLNSLQICAETPYPWVNQPEPYSPDELDGMYAINALMHGDLGSLDFHIDEDSEIHVTQRCA